MSIQNAFESVNKSMKQGAEKFKPAAAQELAQPMMDNLKAWADLAQNQAQAAQAAFNDTLEAYKGIKEPQAAFEVMKASAEKAMAMAAANVKDAIALSVSQFSTGVDTIEKHHPAPEAFAPVAKNMKAAAGQVEDAVDTSLTHGADAIKKARNA